MVSVSKNFGIVKSTGIEKDWYRKKVSDSVLFRFWVSLHCGYTPLQMGAKIKRKVGSRRRFSPLYPNEGNQCPAFVLPGAGSVRGTTPASEWPSSFQKSINPIVAFNIFYDTPVCLFQCLSLILPFQYLLPSWPFQYIP